MTTKEFVTRSIFYSILDNAAFLLSGDINYCFKVDVIYCNGNKETFFTYYFNFSRPDIYSCDLVSISRFTHSDFIIQLKYFAGFYNRLSVHQKDLLINSRKCDNLIKMLHLLK